MNKLIFLVVLAAIGGGIYMTFFGKGSGPDTSTPAGKEAKAFDDHVQQAIDFKDKFDLEYMGPDWGLPGMGPAETKTFVDDVKSKGALGVYVINLKKIPSMMGSKAAYDPEGVVIELPKSAGLRAGVFTAAGKLFTSEGKTAPADVHQKYLYLGRWSSDTPQPGFLPG